MRRLEYPRDRRKEKENILIENFPYISNVRERRRVISRLLAGDKRPDDVTHREVETAIRIERGAGKIITALKSGRILDAMDCGRTIEDIRIDFSEIDGQFPEILKACFLETLMDGIVKRALELKELFGDGIDLSDEVKKACEYHRGKRINDTADLIERTFSVRD